MKNSVVSIVLLFLSVFAGHTQHMPQGVRKLLQAYPDWVKRYDGRFLILKDETKLVYDDGVARDDVQLLNVSSVADMFAQGYIKGVYVPSKGEDAGRVRNEALMKAMYGNTASEVQANLTQLVWCPQLVGAKIKITKINNVHIQLQKVSDELDQHPQLKRYLVGATTFNWRIISGTNRLSTHSFGTSIDLNVKYSNYWQWDCRCKNENAPLNYTNQIPQTIVDIFERHGFIWGGKWYHYDTMHFEYRPELL
ncbi:MAG: hypothetical protein RL662_622 [Bacteroidota bacterium]|jgi:hypothetical protein